VEEVRAQALQEVERRTLELRSEMVERDRIRDQEAENAIFQERQRADRVRSESELMIWKTEQEELRVRDVARLQESRALSERQRREHIARELSEATSEREQLEITMGELAMKAREAQNASIERVDDAFKAGDRDREELLAEVERLRKTEVGSAENAQWYQQRCRDLEDEKVKLQSARDGDVSSVASSRIKSRRTAEYEEERQK
jgi:hypothetical protein